MTEEIATQDKPGAVALPILPERLAVYELLEGSMKGTKNLLEGYDSEEVQRALALGLLGSESVEEVFAAQGLKPWSELLGVPCEVTDVHFNPSKTENGPGFYAVVRLTALDTGEVSSRHIGGYRPMAQLLYSWSRGLVPFKAKVVEVGKAQAGQSAPLGLELL